MGILQMTTVWIPLCNQKVLDYFLNPRYDNNLHQILLDVSRAEDLCLHEVMIESECTNLPSSYGKEVACIAKSRSSLSFSLYAHALVFVCVFYYRWTLLGDENQLVDVF